MTIAPVGSAHQAPATSTAAAAVATAAKLLMMSLRWSSARAACRGPGRGAGRRPHARMDCERSYDGCAAAGRRQVFQPQQP
jgi:hypothetical protein